MKFDLLMGRGVLAVRGFLPGNLSEEIVQGRLPGKAWKRPQKRVKKYPTNFALHEIGFGVIHTKFSNYVVEKIEKSFKPRN